ncbi:MAG TPA: cystathionine beta-lyase [Azospirillaceae bacterium]|nr:cystathionine beta-lyase [Azospirillaceae bacterium]
MTDSKLKNVRPDTLAAHAGLDPMAHQGIVNPPVYHASTVLFPSLEALEESDRNPFDIVNYGRVGTPTTFALEQAVAEMEGGYRSVTAASGLAAIATALSAFARSGDHILVTDSAYGPTRRFCNEVLAGFGVETEYFDPLVSGDIARLIRPNTRLVYLESPGSLTFEVQDVPAIAVAAKARGVAVLMDNTWATPLCFNSFAHGVDVSIHAATKYIVGHSDAMLGLIVCSNKETWEPVKRTAVRFGTTAGPDDVYLGLRGLRTLPVRLKRHHEASVELAVWLKRRPEVARVLHPALPGDPGHALWRRDFTGASGLFAVELKPCSKTALAAMVDHLDLFGLGYSWGGFESLVLPIHPARARTATRDRWKDAGPMVRFHAGLEDVHDLMGDLERGFTRLAAAS